MKPRVVTFHYVLKNESGDVLDSSYDSDPITVLEGSGELIPGLESALQTLKTGEKKQVLVQSGEAYGEYDHELVMDIPRSKFPPEETVEVGDQFRSGPEEDAPVFTVTGITDESVSVDGNHPLAGQDLSFDVEIMEIRNATDEEITHGHVHGAHGHQHH